MPPSTHSSLLRLSLLCVLLVTSFSGHSKTLKFSCPSTEDMPDHGYVKEILQAAAAKQGDSVQVFYATAQQVKRLHDAGELDGDCGRLKGFGTTLNVPKLERIELPFRQVNLSLWKRSHSNKNIKQSRIGILEGAPIIVNSAKNLSHIDTSIYPSREKLIHALSEETIDYILAWDALFYNKKKTLENREIQYHSTVASLPGYIFINRKHKNLKRFIEEEILTRNKSNENYFNFKIKNIPKEVSGQITFSCSAPPNSPAFKQLEADFRHAFEAIDYKFKLIWLPRTRGAAEIMAGRIDGSCGRHSDAIDTIANTSRIPVITAIQEITIWGHSPPSGETNFTLDDLHKTAYTRGTTVIENLLNKKQQSQIIKVTSPLAGIKMLSSKRINHLIAIDASVLLTLNKISLDNPLYKIKTLSKISFYPIINNKYQHLIPFISKELNNHLIKNNRKTILEDIKN